MTVPLVSIRKLRVELGGNPILKGIDADLARGQITALVGLNGSGKSTLLRALVKEIPISGGQISFHCGHDHRHPAPEFVGYVPQKLRIDSHLPLTVVDLFGLSLQWRRPIFMGIGRPLRARVLDLLRQVNAAHLIDDLVEQLSGGEKQRVLLALALKPHPELLLLDEPASGIDFQEEGSFYELIGELNRKTGVTILLVSHDLSAVSRLVHHVLCLAEGHIQCQGPPSEILTGEMLSQTFGAGKIAYGHKH
jgi:zinc transport system ATP-binding protein